MTRRFVVVGLMLAAAPALAADPEAGAEMAVQCAACHGAEGVGVAADIPNLAAQKAAYLSAQLKAFRKSERVNPLMNAIAAQLDDAEIENLAAHFAALPGAAPEAVGAMSAALAGDRPEFPADYAASFTRYHTIDFPERQQVRYYWADPAALEAARAGGEFPAGAYLLVEIHKAELDGAGAPVTGPDGHYVAADLVGYTAMAKAAGWGDEVPAILRNGDWRYAVFSPAGEQRAGVNEAQCLACHKPLSATDYVFTDVPLKEVALR
jgi:cytochrome c553